MEEQFGLYVQWTPKQLMLQYEGMYAYLATGVVIRDVLK